MQTPLYETSDDPRAYRRERAIAAYDRALVAALVRATGGYVERETYVVDVLAQRERSLLHFAQLAREGLAAWPTRWAPSRLMLRALEQRGLTWADVEARL